MVSPTVEYLTSVSQLRNSREKLLLFLSFVRFDAVFDLEDSDKVSETVGEGNR